MAGPFDGVQRMRVGGTRRLHVGPHCVYKDRGLPGTIPADALIVAEITMLEARRRSR